MPKHNMQYVPCLQRNCKRMGFASGKGRYVGKVLPLIKVDEGNTELAKFSLRLVMVGRWRFIVKKLKVGSVMGDDFNDDRIRLFVYNSNRRLKGQRVDAGVDL